MRSSVLSPAAAAELSPRRKSLVLAICCISMVVVVMDISIVNVALPAMGRDLRAPESGLQWTVDAYSLVLAGFLVLAGSTADRVGRRPHFTAIASTSMRNSGRASRATPMSVSAGL